MKIRNDYLYLKKQNAKTKGTKLDKNLKYLYKLKEAFIKAEKALIELKYCDINDSLKAELLSIKESLIQNDEKLNELFNLSEEEAEQEIIKAEYPLDLADKNDDLRDFLQNEVFGIIRIPQGSQEPYDDKSLIFDEPCLECFTLEAKEELENLGYEVAIFKKIEDDDFYIFAYANNEEDLKEAFHYLNTKEYCEFDAEKSTKDYFNIYLRKGA